MALDGIDEDREEEEEKQRKALEKEDCRILKLSKFSDSSNLMEKASEKGDYKNAFAEFMKASMQEENEEEQIDTDTKEKKEKEKEKEESVETLYNKFKFGEGKVRYFTDYLQPQLNSKSRVELPYHQGSWALFSEGELMIEGKSI